MYVRSPEKRACKSEKQLVCANCLCNKLPAPPLSHNASRQREVGGNEGIVYQFEHREPHKIAHLHRTNTPIVDESLTWHAVQPADDHVAFVNIGLSFGGETKRKKVRKPIICGTHDVRIRLQRRRKGAPVEG